MVADFQVGYKASISQLFGHQEEFFDQPASCMTALQIRQRLKEIASQVLPEPAVGQFEELLKLKPAANGGTGVTDDVKYASMYSNHSVK